MEQFWMFWNIFWIFFGCFGYIGTSSLLVWWCVAKKLAFSEPIQRPTLNFTHILKTHFPGSSKQVKLKWHDKIRYFKIFFLLINSGLSRKGKKKKRKKSIIILSKSILFWLGKKNYFRDIFLKIWNYEYIYISTTKWSFIWQKLVRNWLLGKPIMKRKKNHLFGPNKPSPYIFKCVMSSMASSSPRPSGPGPHIISKSRGVTDGWQS